MNILVCMGTRPEAVKLFTVVQALQDDLRFDVEVCVTGQHRGMLDQVLKVVGIRPSVDLDLMRSGQSLTDITIGVLQRFGEVLDQKKPDWVIVQGDTATAFAAALACFYRKIPVAHVEAGLRTGTIYSPYPEEANRKLVAILAQLHFAPTMRARAALLAESVAPENVHVTGNTVVDALLWVRQRLPQFEKETAAIAKLLPAADSGIKIITVTAHRRENFDGGMDRIAEAILDIAKRDDVTIAFPVHPNPNVHGLMEEKLSNHPRIVLLPPLDYVPFIYLLDRSYLVLTDSGGVQEEAPSLGKPVLVMRESTERPECVEAGTARLVGSDRARIVAETFNLLDNAETYGAMSKAHNPFGDGRASQRIVDLIAAASMNAPLANNERQFA